MSTTSNTKPWHTAKSASARLSRFVKQARFGCVTRICKVYGLFNDSADCSLISTNGQKYRLLLTTGTLHLIAKRLRVADVPLCTWEEKSYATFSVERLATAIDNAIAHYELKLAAGKQQKSAKPVKHWTTGKSSAARLNRFLRQVKFGDGLTVGSVRVSGKGEALCPLTSVAGVKYHLILNKDQMRLRATDGLKPIWALMLTTISNVSAEQLAQAISIEITTDVQQRDKFHAQSASAPSPIRAVPGRRAVEDAIDLMHKLASAMQPVGKLVERARYAKDEISNRIVVNDLSAEQQAAFTVALRTLGDYLTECGDKPEDKAVAHAPRDWTAQHDSKACLDAFIKEVKLPERWTIDRCYRDHRGASCILTDARGYEHTIIYDASGFTVLTDDDHHRVFSIDLGALCTMSAQRVLNGAVFAATDDVEKRRAKLKAADSQPVQDSAHWSAGRRPEEVLSVICGSVALTPGARFGALRYGGASIPQVAIRTANLSIAFVLQCDESLVRMLRPFTAVHMNKVWEYEYGQLDLATIEKLINEQLVTEPAAYTYHATPVAGLTRSQAAKALKPQEPDAEENVRYIIQYKPAGQEHWQDEACLTTGAEHKEDRRDEAVRLFNEYKDSKLVKHVGSLMRLCQWKISEVIDTCNRTTDRYVVEVREGNEWHEIGSTHHTIEEVERAIFTLRAAGLSTDNVRFATKLNQEQK